MAGLRVLVVGDAIIDEYQYCEAIGKSSKEPTLVVQAGNAERFAGGALAVANHVAGFCKEVAVAGFMDESVVEVSERLRPNVEFLRCYGPTLVKRRFVEQYHFQKLFEVYDGLHGRDYFDRAALLEKLKGVPHFDVVLAMDFGHGAIDANVVKALTHANFLAVNVQTNAGNLGYQSVRRYQHANYVCLAENEMRLEMRDREGPLWPMMEAVAVNLNCPRVMVTCGKAGAKATMWGVQSVEVPAFAGQVIDRVGAGDAFMSVSAPAVACGTSMEMAAFLGNIAGAQAVATVGHRTSLERGTFQRFMDQLWRPS